MHNIIRSEHNKVWFSYKNYQEKEGIDLRLQVLFDKIDQSIVLKCLKSNE